MTQSKPKVLVIFGTRPEAIKMAPVVKALEKINAIETLTCVTGQHREMLDQVLRVFHITPDFDLAVMKSGQDLTDVTTAVLTKLRDVFKATRPSLVLVHGDTSTTLAASLAAYYAKIPVGHVEAGLRTGDKYSPFPEEINRRVTSCIADVHFAPTENSKKNLVSEGIHPDSVLVTGNTVIDALLQVQENLATEQSYSSDRSFEFLDPQKKTILVTGHRRENFGEGIRNICEALRSIATRSDVNIVYPVHPNPNIQSVVNDLLDQTPGVHLIQPQDYAPFVKLLQKADIILTDSGGIQEEAPSLGKPVLVMRETTERPEAVEAGTVLLVGTDPKLITDTTNRLLDDPEYLASFKGKANPYGDGTAAIKIAAWVTRTIGATH